MTDPVINEIWELATAALDGGQKRFSVHIFPFRMTEPNLAILGTDRWDEFWHDLKKGYDLFEASHTPPQITVCTKRYVARSGTPGSLGDLELVERCEKEQRQQS
jgi:murein L,D-transpeptidase YafK